MPDFDISHTHRSWHPILKSALTQLDPAYCDFLHAHNDWLPGPVQLFNAFSQPLDKLRYILFGESPYPRSASANGYAFWDAAVGDIWAPSGLAKPVNRATSLRNLIKMLLLTEGALEQNDLSQPAIASLDKQPYVQTLEQLFNNLLEKGFLLLNASLTLTNKRPQYDVKQWQPFMNAVLEAIYAHDPTVELILWGNLAKQLAKLPAVHAFKQRHAEHPYNISFICNPSVQDFFRPLRILSLTS